VKDLVLALQSKIYGASSSSTDDELLATASSVSVISDTSAATDSYYANTYFVMTSDNGAPSRDGGGFNGGSNFPLRGYKGKMYEGALRVPAFVHSKLLPSAAVGSTYDGLVHAVDWLKTMTVGWAEVDEDVVSYSDGFNLWPVLSGTSQDEPRTVLPIHMDYVTSEGGVIAKVDGTYFKLFKEACSLWYDATSGNSTVLSYENQDLELNSAAASTFCEDSDTSYFRMYDLSSDPSEINNLYDDESYSTQLAALKAAYCDSYEPSLHADTSYIDDDSSDAWLATAKENGGYLTAWLDAAGDGEYPKSDYWTSSSFCS
jgi:arylsulfatase A-like enzyme